MTNRTRDTDPYHVGDRADLRAEVEQLRRLLVFADGAAVTGLGLALSDLYSKDCAWAQETLARAGCHPRGTVTDRRVIPDTGDAASDTERGF